MSTKYREFASQTRLQNAIECFWTGETPPFDAVQRVVPHGCADILFSRGAGKPDLQVVGTMSRYADFQLPAGQILIGVRFHPGMLPPFLRAPAHELADKAVPLEDLWGRAARGLREELANSSTIPDAIAAFERYLKSPEMNAREIAMWAWLRQGGGEARLDELARLSGLGTRQLRPAMPCPDRPDAQTDVPRPSVSPRILTRARRDGLGFEKVQEYLDWGVEYVWVIDPARKSGWSYSKTGRLQRAEDGVLTEPFALNLREI